jgi:hypothetical protein
VPAGTVIGIAFALFIGCVVALSGLVVASTAAGFGAGPLFFLCGTSSHLGRFFFRGEFCLAAGKIFFLLFHRELGFARGELSLASGHLGLAGGVGGRGLFSDGCRADVGVGIRGG